MRTSLLSIVAAACASLLGTASQAAEFRTTQCSKHGHPEISFQVSSAAIPDVDPQWLVQGLEEMVASGSRFKAGETLQLGWMINRFEQGPGGTLRLHEPDMQSMPIKFVDSADATLKAVRRQKDTTESFSQPVPMAFPSLVQSIIVPPDYQTVATFSLERREPEDRSSGWAMVGGDETPTKEQFANYKLVSLYEFALHRPELVHLLAMPPGTVIGVPAKGPPQYFLDEKPLTVAGGSYLDLLDAARQRDTRAGSK